MKLVICLSILMASSAWAADEAADRAAIEKVISTLNNSPNSAGLFTDDFPDTAALKSLGVYRIAIDSGQPTIHVSVSAISMCVSHEPMGELEPCGGIAGIALTPAHFAIRSLRMITSDVALVDTVLDRDFAGPSRQPVLLVVRKENDLWRIASLRVMARPAPQIAQ